MTEFRRITSQGRIVIPQGYLDELGLSVGDHIRIELIGEFGPNGDRKYLRLMGAE